MTNAEPMTRDEPMRGVEPTTRVGGALRPAPALLLSLAAVAIAACAPSDRPGDASGAPPATGRLVIVGGALDAETAPVWEAVIEGRDGAGPVCVLPTASAAPERSMRSVVETLDRYGGPGTAMGVLIAEGEIEVADDPATGGTLLGCSGYWFTGGSQSRITATLLPDGEATVALQAIRTRFGEGAVIAGTSAGAAIMSPLMIAGGSSGEAWTGGVLAEAGRGGGEGDGPAASGEVDDEGVRIQEGLGFFRAGVLDQHFLARGRIGRLLVAVLEHPDIEVGFGIDENTAMVVDGDSATVVGASGVVVVDRTGAGADGPLTVFLAGSGDVIELEGLEVTPAADKRPIEAGDAALPEVGIFERWAFLDALVAFSRRLDVGMVVPTETTPFSLEKGDGFFAVHRATGEGISTAPPGFSAGPFTVELESR